MQKKDYSDNIIFDFYEPSSFNKDLEKIKEGFLTYIKLFKTHICAETIEKVTFAVPELYGEAVKVIGLKNQQVLDGSLAITLTNKNDYNTLGHHLIFNLTPYFFENLKYNENTIINFPYANFLAHEMAHVDLINSLHAIDSNICFGNQVDQIEKRRFLIELKRSFEEFFACKLSSYYCPHSPLEEGYKNHVIQYISEVTESLTQLIQEYKKNHDLNFYFESCYKLLLNVFLYSGYYLGCTQKSSELLESEFIDLKKLNDIFNQLFEYFYNIGNYRESITLDVFDELINYFEELLESNSFLTVDRKNNIIHTSL